MAGSALRVFQWSAIWFTGNPVAVAAHAVTISWLTAVNWSGAGGARIIAASPVVAILRCPRSQYSDVHSNFLGVGDKRLLPFMIGHRPTTAHRSEEHTSELQSLMRISYAVFCLKQKKDTQSYQFKVNTTNHN